MNAPQKPLKAKAYGHIPHLPNSRIGPGDHHCHEGQAKIATVKARDRHDEIFVQEKLDGSCVAVYRSVENEILALSRSGYLAQQSPYVQHHVFADWVRKNTDRFQLVLEPGDRIVGEWIALAHGTIYQLTHDPFVAFDIMRKDVRSPYDEFVAKNRGTFVIPRLIHRGGPISVEAVLDVLEPSGHGAVDPVEGAVWRIQHKGKIDFLCKWVRPDKADGKYLPEVSGKDPIWNWRP